MRKQHKIYLIWGTAIPLISLMQLVCAGAQDASVHVILTELISWYEIFGSKWLSPDKQSKWLAKTRSNSLKTAFVPSNLHI